MMQQASQSGGRLWGGGVSLEGAEGCCRWLGWPQTRRGSVGGGRTSMHTTCASVSAQIEAVATPACRRLVSPNISPAPR